MIPGQRINQDTNDTFIHSFDKSQGGVNGHDQSDSAPQSLPFLPSAFRQPCGMIDHGEPQLEHQLQELKQQHEQQCAALVDRYFQNAQQKRVTSLRSHTQFGKPQGDTAPGGDFEVPQHQMDYTDWAQMAANTYNSSNPLQQINDVVYDHQSCTRPISDSIYQTTSNNMAALLTMNNARSVSDQGYEGPLSNILSQMQVSDTPIASLMNQIQPVAEQGQDTSLSQLLRVRSLGSGSTSTALSQRMSEVMESVNSSLQQPSFETNHGGSRVAAPAINHHQPPMGFDLSTQFAPSNSFQQNLQQINLQQLNLQQLNLQQLNLKQLNLPQQNLQRQDHWPPTNPQQQLLMGHQSRATVPLAGLRQWHSDQYHQVDPQQQWNSNHQTSIGNTMAEIRRSLMQQDMGPRGSDDILSQLLASQQAQQQDNFSDNQMLLQALGLQAGKRNASSGPMCPKPIPQQQPPPLNISHLQRGPSSQHQLRNTFHEALRLQQQQQQLQHHHQQHHQQQQHLQQQQQHNRLFQGMQMGRHLTQVPELNFEDRSEALRMGIYPTAQRRPLSNPNLSGSSSMGPLQMIRSLGSETVPPHLLPYQSMLPDTCMANELNTGAMYLPPQMNSFNMKLGHGQGLMGHGGAQPKHYQGLQQIIQARRNQLSGRIFDGSLDGGTHPSRVPHHVAAAVEPLPQFKCDICAIQCNSEVNLDQHLASRKHLAKAARLAAYGETSADPNGRRCTTDTCIVHSSCRQMITPELDAVVIELLLSMKSLQEAIPKPAVTPSPATPPATPPGTAAHRWFMCGLREVRKAVKLLRAKSVVIAPNIEQMDAAGGLDDHLHDILSMCKEQNLPIIFSLSRKRLGQIYGCRKRVSAVALLDLQGVEELHASMLHLMDLGQVVWEEKCKEAQGVPPIFMLEADSDDEEQASAAVEGQEGAAEGREGGIEDQERAVECQKGAVEGQEGGIEGQKGAVEGQEGAAGGQEGGIEGHERAVEV